MSDEQKTTENQFAVYATRKSDLLPLIQTHLPFGRLMDEIIVPYENEKTFFVDGAPIKATDVDRIKIIRQEKGFNEIFNNLHHYMRWGDLKRQELYARQYHVRMEALLREYGEDVTSQAIHAYRTVIKPQFKDYLPNKEALLNAAIKVFYETLKVLSKPQP